MAYDWQHIQDCIESSATTTALTTTTANEVPSDNISPIPLYHYKPHVSRRIVSIRSMDVEDSNETLYGTADDDFGCYKWDMETGKVLTTYESVEDGTKLQTVRLVDQGTHLLTGGSDGLVVSKQCINE